MTNDVKKNSFYVHITQLNIWLSYRQARNCTPRYLSEKNENMCPQKEFCMNVISSFIHNTPK